MSQTCHEETSRVRVAQKKSRPKAALSKVFFAPYCSPTGPENAPLLPLAWTMLFPAVSSAPPPEELRPVPLPMTPDPSTRTVTFGPSERMPSALFTDLVFLT
jgi:hypothetical protein